MATMTEKQEPAEMPRRGMVGTPTLQGGEDVTSLSTPPWSWSTYEDFGPRFMHHAVTSARIEAAIAGIAGRGVTIGPFSVGPARLASFVAEGKIGQPTITPHGGSLSFAARIPVSLAATVHLGGKKLQLETVVAINLTLHARTADPLLIVIDIPPVTPRDVRVVLRAQALESVGELILDPIAGLIRREVAQRVNTLLTDPRTRRKRVFDVPALLDKTDSPHRSHTDFTWIDYAEFGRRFFPRIVTAARVDEVVQQFSGRPIEVGPLRTGPRASATVTVRGALRAPELTPRPTPPGELVRFDLLLPVWLDITVDVLRANRYRADVWIPLVLTVRTADPLRIVVEVTPPERADIRLEFHAVGMRAATLGVMAGIRQQIIAQVLRVVRREIEAGASVRVIDVAQRIDSAVEG